MKRSLSADNTVIIEMSRREYQELLVILGFASASASIKDPAFALAVMRFTSELIDANQEENQ